MEKEYAILLVKPPSYKRPGVVDKVKEMIGASGLEIVDHQAISITQNHIERLYAKHKGKDYYSWLVGQMTSGYAYIFLVRGENAPRVVRDLAGPTLPEKARMWRPDCIRALLTPEWESFELSRTESRAVDNVVHTPDPNEPGAVQSEGAIFYPRYFPED